jgi:hypothetical protein
MYPIKTDLCRYSLVVNGLGLGNRPTTDLFPDLNTIYPEFWRSFPARLWEKFQADWFFEGLASHTLIPREGVDTVTAFRHLNVVQRSWDIPHEDKVKAVTWLLHEWFSGGTWVAGLAPAPITATPRKRIARLTKESKPCCNARSKKRCRNGYSYG